jgi:DNA-binding MarR family transcriptional regulator
VTSMKTGALPPHDQLEALYGRPGFLIRRAHQIAQALFEEEASETGLTASQMGALTVVFARGPLDQIGLARAMGVDRSTAGLVLKNLAQNDYINRIPDPEDRRRNLVTITELGLQALRQVQPAALAVKERLLAAFIPAEADEFVRLLTKLVNSMNAEIRTPLLRD